MLSVGHGASQCHRAPQDVYWISLPGHRGLLGNDVFRLETGGNVIGLKV